MITLYDASDDITIELPDDLHWVDEFDWSPVAQSAEYTLGGCLVIEESAKLAGRPITLGGAHDDMGWVTRETVLALQGRRNIPGRTFTLTLKDARTFTVVFRQSDTPITAVPVLAWNQTESGHWYSLALRFMEV